MTQTALTPQDRVGQTNAGAQFAPAVAALPGSAYVIAWLDSARGAIYGQLYNSAGQGIGSEFQVSSPGPAPLFASVAALEGGGFIIAWQNGSFNSADIHARRYSAAGAPIGSEFTVNSSLPNEQLDVRVIGLEGGGFLVTWDNIASDTFLDVSGRIYNAAGEPIGPDFTLNTTVIEPQGISSIAPLAGGGFVATWQSVRASGVGVDLIGQRFTASGGKIGSEFQINAATVNNPVGNDVARLSDGSFVVSWVDPVPSHGGGRIVARHYDASGNAIGGEITIASKASGDFGSTSVTALTAGGYLVSWTNNDGTSAQNQLTARAMGANDTPAGSAFAVSTAAPFSTVLTSDGSATLANGHVVFTWDGPSTNTSEDVYHRMFAIDATQSYFEGDSGDDTVLGTGADDYFDLSQGGNDSASGGDGDDAFYFGATFGATDAVDGGAGTNDQIGLRGDYSGANALTLGAGTIAGIEVIAVLPGFDYALATVDANVPAGGTLKVFAGSLGAGDDFTFDGSAETDGTFMVYAGAGADHITTGAGSDGIYFGPGKFDPSVDRVDGGAGSNDQLALDGHYTLTLDGIAIQNIDAIALLGGATGDLATYALTLADSLVGAGQSMTIWGAPVKTALTVNGAAESNGTIRVYGGTVGDTLTGGAGGDWFWGGLGSDTLTGGGGPDTFSYTAAAESAGATFDRISGFDDAADTIDLPFAVSGLATATSGTLDAATIGAQLEAAFAGLGHHQAAVETATGGDMVGRTFLVVDADGVTGYQHGSDYLIEIASPASPIDNPALFT